ncbi:hypothetical protein [Acidianus brierleyi]|uniref:Uncharacterized protein n=1 Tax=Acidianus brierleyi TaxID=41673 RepID=A0A2U9II36_9CREN|nr:hypothetical protein [Acidianus brierleyi]AWR95712.1 hypothetical protein DFR85_15080 [Acidianus brierleyi]
MHEEEQEWLQAAKLGLGYMGWPGHPFGNYYPPWVKSTDPSKSVSSENSTAVTPLVLLLLPVLLVPEVFQSKIYLIKS